jgi:replicative DNA helicase
MTSDPNRSQSFERALPNSSEAERAILGAILLDNGLINQAVDLVEASDYYVPSHRWVYEAMLALYEKGSEINPVLIGEELKKRGVLESVGGISFITNLTYGLPRSTNILHYAKVVKGKAMLRQLIKTSNKITQEALEEEDEPEVILDHAEQAIFSLRDERERAAGGKREVSLKEVAVQARTHLLELNKNVNTAIPTPWPNLNNACRGGFNPTELWGLIAAQKHGKSAAAKQVAKYAAERGHRILIFSREMSELKIFFRLLAPLTEIPVSQIRYGLDENRILRSIGATKDLESLGIFLNTKTSDIDEARIRTREMVRLEGIDLVIADYANQFSAKVRKGANRSEEVAAIWRGFKNNSQEFGIATLALGHPTSDAFEREHQKRPKEDQRQAPYFHQSAESREAAKAVDVGLVLWTETGRGEPGARPATIYIDYQRDEDAGGSVPLIFDGRIMEFHQPRSGLDFNE